MLTLFWGPHTCAIGTHVLLEEVGCAYDTRRIDKAGGATHRAPFIDMNPKAKVPVVVRDDGSVLTEFGAIARWLALTHPEAGLLPQTPERDVRAIELMDYIVGTVHGQGFARIFLPGRFMAPEAEMEGEAGRTAAEAVRRQGRDLVERAFVQVERRIVGDYAAGERLTVADAALFYVERWAPQIQLRLPGRLDAHLHRMKARPAVRRVLALWGEE